MNLGGVIYLINEFDIKSTQCNVALMHAQIKQENIKYVFFRLLSTYIQPFKVNNLLISKTNFER